VREEGVSSVSVNGSKLLAWRDITAFEIDGYIGGTVAVFARRQDGTRVALGDTARWPYQRQSVEQVKSELERYRESSTAHGGLLVAPYGEVIER
jgi:hypothetical protein